MQVVELSRENPLAMLARVTSWLGRLTEPLRLTRLPLVQILMASGLQPGLRRRSSSARLTSVNNRSCDEYLRTLPRKRVAAGVLLRDAEGKVVLIEPSYKDTWEIPGGVVESGESPWLAAERELKEELGLVRRNMPVLVVDYVPLASDGMPEGLLWIFDGGLLDDSEREGLRGTDKEVKSVKLLPIGEAVKRTKGSLALRLTVALEAALAQQENVYCEQGKPRSSARLPSEREVQEVRA